MDGISLFKCLFKFLDPDRFKREKCHVMWGFNVCTLQGREFKESLINMSPNKIKALMNVSKV